jgi:cytoskeletal protein RodZ
MKRCPQCQFIYPDADRVCDFDQSPLVAATESEIAAITNTPERPALADLAATHSRNFATRKNRRTLPIAAAIGLLLGITVVGVYFAVHRQMNPKPLQEQAVKIANQPVVQLPSPSPSASRVESPTPEQTTAVIEKPSAAPTKTTTAHTTTNAGPVSTSTPGTSAKTNAKQVILLTGGGKVEADEVWRTKDGVWYRRDGVVTLLKKNRVKAIVSQ